MTYIDIDKILSCKTHSEAAALARELRIKGLITYDDALKATDAAYRNQAMNELLHAPYNLVNPNDFGGNTSLSLNSLVVNVR